MLFSRRIKQVKTGQISMIWIWGFIAICVPAAAIILLCLTNNMYNSGVGDVLDLCMDVLGSLVCVLLYYGCMSVRADETDSTASNVKAFIIPLFLNAMILLVDTIMWAWTGHPSLRTANILVSVLFFAADDLLFFFFWRYAVETLRLDDPKTRRMDSLLRVLLVPAVLLCLVNLFVPIYFRITEEGIYQKAAGYALGYWYLLLTFVMLIVIVFRGRILAWQKLFAVLFAMIPIAILIATRYLPDVAVVYTAASIAILMINCVLFTANIHLKELIIRVFSLMLLCAMLLCGPMLYRVSLNITAALGYERAEGAFAQTVGMLDEAGLNKLLDQKNTGLYQEKRQELRDICRAFRLENLYVETIDPEAGSRSFVMVVAAEDEADKTIQKTLGWPGASTWSEESYLTEPEKAALKGELSDEYSEQNNVYGHNLDWFFPYKDKHGKVVALIGADYEIRSQQIDAMQHTIANSFPVLGLYMITLLVLIHVLNRTFVKPIHAISGYIARFLSDGKNKEQSHVEWSGYEIGQLDRSFGIMTSELAEYEEKLKKETAERTRINSELELAAGIQSGYLPGDFPAFPDRNEFEVYAIMEPAKIVGGDFFDFFLVDEDHLALLAADVCGKGIPASLFMMISKTMLKNTTQLGFTPAGVLEVVNEQLAADNKNLMFVTVWLGILELSTGRLVFASAGHERPVLYRDHRWEILETRSKMPLGLRKRKADPLNPEYYENESIVLAPNDALLQYSDGVTEATNKEEEMFRENGLLVALNNAPTAEPEALLPHLMKDIEAFVDGADQADDITLLGLKYYGRQ